MMNRALRPVEIDFAGDLSRSPLAGIPNLHQNLNRETWFATLHILNSVGWGVNSVFCVSKVRRLKPVHCLKGQGWFDLPDQRLGTRRARSNQARPPELYCRTK